MNTNLSNAVNAAVRTLENSARALRRELEALDDRHTVTDGLTPERRSGELVTALENHHQYARGLVSSLAAKHARAVAVGEEIPSDYEARAAEASKLSGRILAVTNLEEAYALVSSIREDAA